MSGAFLYSSGGSSGLPKLQCTCLYSDVSFNSKTIPLTHSDSMLFIITSSGDSNGYTVKYRINGTYIDQWSPAPDGNYSTTYNCTLGEVFILAVKNGEHYDLCKLDGTVIKAGVDDLIFSYASGRTLSVTTLQALE